MGIFCVPRRRCRRHVQRRGLDQQGRPHRRGLGRGGEGHARLPPVDQRAAVGYGEIGREATGPGVESVPTGHRGRRGLRRGDRGGYQRHGGSQPSRHCSQRRCHGHTMCRPVELCQWRPHPPPSLPSAPHLAHRPRLRPEPVAGHHLPTRAPTLGACPTALCWLTSLAVPLMMVNTPTCVHPVRARIKGVRERMCGRNCAVALVMWGSNDFSWNSCLPRCARGVRDFGCAFADGGAIRGQAGARRGENSVDSRPMAHDRRGSVGVGAQQRIDQLHPSVG